MLCAGESEERRPSALGGANGMSRTAVPGGVRTRAERKTPRGAEELEDDPCSEQHQWGPFCKNRAEEDDWKE
jgi:hypothetical protein